MAFTLGLPAPRRLHCLVKTRGATTVRCSWIPDYSLPEPGNFNKHGGSRTPNLNYGERRASPIRFWEYQAPTADIGSPEGYELPNISIPEYGAPGGGNGGGSGGWGSGGGGGGGSGGSGDPMKGFTYLYALALFAAGLTAYIKRGSNNSLIVSCAAAALLLVGASLMGHPTSRSGTLLALGTCATLAGVMGYRAKESGKFMPAGLVAAISALMTAGYVGTLI